ncbi:MAG: hypothetical protein IJW00_05905 [Clostridia bacterium]|nr:hypothetical protein [Clostridia bacterium]
MFDVQEMINVLEYTSRYDELRGQACSWYIQTQNKPCFPGSDLEKGLVVEKAKSEYYKATKEDQEKWDKDCTLLLDYLDLHKRSMFPYDESKPLDKGGCYVATCVYGSYDCPEVWTLRRFRDQTLGSTWYGRAFIRTYYAISPTLVKWFGDKAWFKKMWKTPLDNMVSKLESKGVENTPYKDQEW